MDGECFGKVARCLLLLIFLVIIVVEQRPLVFGLGAVDEQLARAAFHDDAGDQADHDAGTDHAADALVGLEQEVIYLLEVHGSSS